ncbi:MAG TPA: hypothetical protein VJQ09_08670, partial [Candidatus Limnocylindria bacterium]|nr:hypothetical protein [Candidatus Limnocylindria bacterium]
GNGAQTWTQQLPSTLPFAQCKSSLAFLDAFRGFVTLYDTTGQSAVLRTRDGGATWVRAALATPPDSSTPVQPGAVRVTGATAVLIASGSGAQYLYRSTDSGATWGLVDKAPNDLVIASATRWLRFTPGAMQETTDGGATWHAYASDYTQAAGVPPVVVFADANIGYATVRGTIQRTLDGGAHWTRIKTPGT